MQVMKDGSEEPVRLLIDSSEAYDLTIPSECYGAEAYYFLNWLLSLGGTRYLGRDVSDHDDVEHLLRYAWLDIGDGEVYLVNEAMVRSGYAAHLTVAPDVKYEEEIREAARFAREHEYGLWSWCVTEEEGDTNELMVSDPETASPESEPIDEEPVPSDTRSEPVIISDPLGVFG